VYDGRAFDIDIPETMLPMTQILEEGSKAERLEALREIGLMLRSRMTLPAAVAEWLGCVLERISDGVKPHVALRLNTRRRVSLREQLAQEHMVRTAKNATTQQAMDVAGRFRPKDNTLRDSAADSARVGVKKRLERRKQVTRKR
jgi:hypothetical protein